MGRFFLTPTRYTATATLIVEAISRNGIAATTSGALQAAPTYANLIVQPAVLSAADVSAGVVHVSDSTTSLEIGITATASTAIEAAKEANTVAMAFLDWTRMHLYGSLITNYPIELIAPAVPSPAAGHSLIRMAALAFGATFIGLALGYMTVFGIDWWRKVRTQPIYITGVWPIAKKDEQ